MRGRHRRLMLAAMLVVAAAGATASAKTQRPGVLSGRVVDDSGSVLPGVEIRIADLAGQVLEKVVTDKDGRFRAELPVGPAKVTASLLGFMSASRTVRIDSSAEAIVEMILRVGCLAEEIIVIPRSLAEAMARSNAVAHIRIVRQLPPDPQDPGLAIRFDAVVLRWVKPPAGAGAIVVEQPCADGPDETGRLLMRTERPLRAGDEQILFLGRLPGSVPSRVGNGRLAVWVRDGKVRFDVPLLPGIKPGDRADEVLRALQQAAITPTAKPKR